LHSIASAGNHCPDVQLYDSSWKFATIFDVPEPVPTFDTVQPLAIDWLFNNNGAAIIAFVANMPRNDKDKIEFFNICFLLYYPGSFHSPPLRMAKGNLLLI